MTEFSAQSTPAVRAGDANYVTLAIEEGALIEVPVGMYESHKRGRNWLAVITADPSAPSGLGRTFARVARGDYFYVVDGLRVGQAVEFGADYYSGSGHKHAKRWYGVVVDLTDSTLTLEAAVHPTTGNTTPGTALKLARAYAGAVNVPTPIV